MKRYRLALGLGFLLWFVPFLISFLVFPLRVSHLAFFEAIMTAVLALCVTPLAIFYFRKAKLVSVREGALLGVLWLAVSLLMDLLMFSWGPMQMPLPEYLSGIGLNYLVYPVFTIGFGYAARAVSLPSG